MGGGCRQDYVVPLPSAQRSLPYKLHAMGALLAHHDTCLDVVSFFYYYYLCLVVATRACGMLAYEGLVLSRQAGPFSY